MKRQLLLLLLYYTKLINKLSWVCKYNMILKNQVFNTVNNENCSNDSISNLSYTTDLLKWTCKIAKNIEIIIYIYWSILTNILKKIDKMIAFTYVMYISRNYTKFFINSNIPIHFVMVLFLLYEVPSSIKHVTLKFEQELKNIKYSLASEATQVKIIKNLTNKPDISLTLLLQLHYSCSYNFPQKILTLFHLLASGIDLDCYHQYLNAWVAEQLKT